ncbi:MAG: endolytic transglycosylase MltG [Candidatus Magasanikbacteria bacterium]
MNKKLFKLSSSVFLLVLLFFSIQTYYVIFTKDITDGNGVVFEVIEGESVKDLAGRLEKDGIIFSQNYLVKYLSLRNIDRNIRMGFHSLKAPVTIASVADELTRRIERGEREITILPGWNLRDIATYFENLGIAQAEEITEMLGLPAVDYTTAGIGYPTTDFYDIPLIKYKPKTVSYEGYISPDTFRVYEDATLEEIVRKLLEHRDSQFTEQMYADIKKSGRTVHEVITLAGILEREVRSEKDKAKVADLFWRRYDKNWALQADSTVHYATGKFGDVFTSAEDREVDSLWNTYEYPGLPPTAISNPDLDSIMAAIYPEKNNAWYFLTDLEGNVHYAGTLDEHNANANKYLR